MPKSTIQVVLSEERKLKVAELVCSGKNMKEAAEIVGISTGRASQIMKEKRLEWAAREQVAVGDHIKIEIEKLNELDDAAKQGWLNSLNPSSSVLTRKVKPREDKNSKKVRGRLPQANKELLTVMQEETITTVAGDPRFLKIRMDLSINKLKLLNAFPKEETNTNVTIQQFDFSQFTDPIPCEAPIALTPADEVEARIAAESQSPNNNGNGQNGTH